MALPTTMTAIEISTPGGPEALTPTERPVPQPAKGEVLIEVHAAGVNRPDVLQRMGKYDPPPGASDIPGLEVAGVIVALGEGVTDWKVGDKICALLAGGGYAEYAAAPGRTVPADPERSIHGRGGGPARNLLHGVEQCVRSRASEGGRDLPRPWRLLGHRYDRDPARQGLRRQGVHDRRAAPRNAPPASNSAPTGRSITRRRTSSRSSRPRPAARASTWCWIWSAATTSHAPSRSWRSRAVMSPSLSCKARK